MDKKTVVYQIINQHYAENYPALVKRASRMVGEFWAEDVAQDTYERAFKYWERLPIDFVGIGSYLRIMLNNRIKDYQNDRLSTVEVEEFHIESGELADEIQAVGVLAEVKAHLLTFPEDVRSAIYLHLFCGEKQQTVSQVLNMRQQLVSELCTKFQAEVKERYELQ